MRGALIVMVLMTLLIVGYLVMRNMQEENVEGMTKVETMQKAKDTAADAQKKIDELSNKLKNIQK